MMIYLNSKLLQYNYFNNMINRVYNKNRKLPVLKFTVVLMIVISILFPALFAYINHETDLIRLLKDILITASVVTTISLFTFSVITLFNKAQAKGFPYWLRQIAELTAVLVGSFYFLYVVFMITRNIYDSPSVLLLQMQFRLNISVNLLGAVFIYILEKSLSLYQIILTKDAQAEKLQEEYSQVRLQALKSQINPHFLFNSLSVLSSLVHTNPETSERFILQLSIAYRYILDQKNSSLVTLKEELDFLEAYFFLLQIRFGNKIKMNKFITLNPEIYQLPPLTLQLLVENAVKHNKMSATEPLTIELIAIENKIEVKNNFNPREVKEPSTGIGLNNIVKRVAYVTNEQVLITQEEEWFRAIIPLSKQ